MTDWKFSEHVPTAMSVVVALSFLSGYIFNLGYFFFEAPFSSVLTLNDQFLSFLNWLAFWSVAVVFFILYIGGLVRYFFVMNRGGVRRAIVRWRQRGFVRRGVSIVLGVMGVGIFVYSLVTNGYVADPSPLNALHSEIGAAIRTNLLISAALGCMLSGMLFLTVGKHLQPIVRFIEVLIATAIFIGLVFTFGSSSFDRSLWRATATGLTIKSDGVVRLFVRGLENGALCFNPKTQALEFIRWDEVNRIEVRRE
jgi:hypothetical protein